MFQVAVVGARGYLGRELVRMLLSHPEVDRIVPVSLSGAGGELGASVPAFRHVKDLRIRAWDDQEAQGWDAIFFATAHGEAAGLVGDVSATTPVVDLSRDHRQQALAAQKAVPQLVTVLAGGVPAATQGGATWAYGLADSPFQVQPGATRIANPGCYPTAGLLAALPVVQAGLAAPGPIIVDGKSGVSGAGATPRADLHFTETNESVRAYKVLGHDHLHEIQGAIACFDPGHAGAAKPRAVRFTPHLVPQNRGLLATVYVPLQKGVGKDDVAQAYHDAYADAKTVRLVEEADTAHVRGTGLCDIAFDVDSDANMLVARGAIDNLVKGGAGQAIHNFNLALGLQPFLGLPMVGGGP